MNLAGYGDFVEQMWVSGDLDPEISRERLNELLGMAIAGMGLMGEAGEAGEIVKKFVRSRGRKPLDREKLVKELGDTFFYWMKTCRYFDIDPWQVMNVNMEKLGARKAAGVIGGTTSGDERDKVAAR